MTELTDLEQVRMRLDGGIDREDEVFEVLLVLRSKGLAQCCNGLKNSWSEGH